MIALWLCSWLLQVPVLYWQGMVLVCLWAVPLAWFVAPVRIRLKTVGVLALVAGLLTSTLAARYTADVAWWCSLIESRALYAGPSKQYHLIAHLDEGALVCITDVRDGWMCVSAQKCRGWLPLTEE